jgi:hypothetical protein
MKKNSVYLSIVSASFAVVMLGCAKVPEQELSAAKASLDSARVYEADKYMASDFAAAQDSLKAAITEIEKQKSSNQMSRNYDKAKALLASATTLAQNARSKAADAKQKVQAEVDTLLITAAALISENKDLLAKAPKGKEGKAVLEAIGSEISAVESNIGEAKALKSSGDLIGARDKANAGIVKLESVKVEIAAAIEKPSPKAKPAEGKKK